ncbi:MAG: hypothetical protein ACKVU4_06760 [Phycisphaerales bacterium]
MNSMNPTEHPAADPTQAGNSGRLVLLLVAVAALTGSGLYFALWHRGGFRTGWGMYSGSRLPAEAAGLAPEARMAQSIDRANVIRAAVLQHETRHGRLPTSLDQLGDLLPTAPSPLTSTQPFRYSVDSEGNFRIHWEAWPNAMYECHWIERDGALRSDF